jgi:glucose dehydrogenase
MPAVRLGLFFALCLVGAFAKPVVLLADTDARLRHAATNDTDWLTYSHGYANQRHSGLATIHRGNVARLVPKWIYQTGVDGTFQTSPIVLDGVVYLTTPRNHIVALDGETGAVRWKYTHTMKIKKPCCGTHNRGLAIGYGRLYQITADARLVAVDRDNGEVVWDVPVLDPATSESDAPQKVRDMQTLSEEETSTWTSFMGNMAPLVYEGMVIVGTTGAGYTSVFGEEEDDLGQNIGRSGTRRGLRAFISAYEANSGRLIWRWYSTKDKDWEGDYVTTTSMGDVMERDIATEKANADKYRDAWSRGGGSIYSSPALDVERGLLFFGTGNAAPYADLYRPGDNLYTASLVALDIRTGQLRWYHQITPHDIWGYDLATPPVLIDVPLNGKMVPGIAQATKSGWMYFFNRVTGEVIRRSEPFVPQSNLFKRAKDATGVTVAPGGGGGANWPPVSYSPETGWVYVAGSHFPSVYKLERDANGNDVNVLAFAKNADNYGTVSAIDPASGKIMWQGRMSKPFSGGITTTAGGLLFMGESDGHFTARDTRSGEMLWRFQTGAGVNAPPVTYAIDGKQYVIVAAGGNKFFKIASGNAVIAFSLFDPHLK